MSLSIRVVTRFERDVKRMARRHKDLTKLETVIATLVAEEPLPSRYRDHALTGDLHGWRDIHVEPDWLLIYRINRSILELILLRTGTHADIFEE
jgi:mRNA interferase YafQ